MAHITHNILAALIFLSSSLFASAQTDWEDFEYGIYEDFGLVAYDSPEMAAKAFIAGLDNQSGLTLLLSRASVAPDYVQEDADDKDGRAGWLICLDDSALLTALANAHPKYVVAGQIRVGFHQEPSGLRMTMLQPETFVRIVANDLKEDAYLALAKHGAAAAKRVRALAKTSVNAPCPGTHREPLREGEDIFDADRDMFMMVGKMTYFEDEDQFPLLWSAPIKGDSQAALESAVKRIENNLAAFSPAEDDADYRWSPKPTTDLKWAIQTRQQVDGKAILLTVCRPRTEALSMKIASASRSEDGWQSPGLDHVTAFPIEVLLYVDNGQVNLRTAREMFRMDQFFWDAGKMAFMKYKNMPDMLDDSLASALVGNVDL
ncbi:MAG: hypothetical protein HOM34_09865 [Planctomycetes bacterium]|jgi:hypothetical protein|nr:hypothetical protein [Planctomycetota bacterium]MBT4029413.1 hypothetical protein [Planctomycetota bacterium]MBT4561241.1 hypothetical protein [Planctomycetota bacterium]MBT5121014.1 hypothetical protein [Planctomycetota bacterium]MBT7012588.1 hypothetical protein [Planctomycetota bacterium]